jgi:hypothetical protein
MVETVAAAPWKRSNLNCSWIHGTVVLRSVSIELSDRQVSIYKNILTNDVQLRERHVLDN